MPEWLHDISQFLSDLPDHLGDFARQYGWMIYLLLAGIVFCETGLVITPFLPGDSLAYSIMHHALGLAEFLELSSNTYRGLASGIVSFFGWLISLITALLITAKVDQSVETRRRALGYSDEER